jgi:putative CocE/NonD family hydrolase
MQLRFFDCYLKGDENGMRAVPPVRLEVRCDRTTVHEVRAENAWPLPSTRWTPLYLAGDGTLRASPSAQSSVAFDARSGFASFVRTFSRDTELTGPTVLHVRVSLEGCDDATLFAFVRKIDRKGANVPFEGSYGFGYDPVAKGRLRLSLRKTDPERSQPLRPFYPFDESQPLRPGEIVDATIEMLASATYFSAGESLQLDVRGRWLFSRPNIPIRGPAFYEHAPAGRIVLHYGADTNACLVVPVV